MPYLVGEAGPELFVPSTAGHVIPNNRLSSGSVAMAGGPTVNVYAGSIIHENDLVDVIQRAVGRYRRSTGSDPF